MISVVLYGRNDSYGYNLHKRAALSFNCIAELLHDDDDEILFVDYNTPNDFPTFPEAIKDTLTPQARRRLRVLRVRPHIHDRLRDRTRLVAIEPLSRNVAVRRSNPRNRWILSTNTDMIFVPNRAASLNDVVRELPSGFYHAPRLEIPETLWEGLDRGRPREVIDTVRAWGRTLHLNEIVRGSDFILYDGPGDFQLLERDVLFEVQGFHEEMILGWHVDSNIAKRLFIHYGGIGDLGKDVFGYHCDHTRQMTPMHSRSRTMNDEFRFIADVDRPDIPEQALTWGCAEDEIEEVRLQDDSSALYVASLLRAVAPPLADTPVVDYTGESFNKIPYYPSHVLPFLIDLFVCSPKHWSVGWFGGADDTLTMFAQIWASLGFTGRILVDADVVSAAEAELRPALSRQPLSVLIDRANAFVFNFTGGLDAASAQAPAGQELETDKAVRRGFCQVVLAEQQRGRDHLSLRQIAAVNAINNDYENLVNAHVAAGLTPFATRMRHGYALPTPVGPQDWTADLWAAAAGIKEGPGIAMRPDIVGFVAYGPYKHLLTGRYRLVLELSGTAPVAAAEDTVASVEIRARRAFIDWARMTARHLRDGRLALEFDISQRMMEEGARLETVIRSWIPSRVRIVKLTCERIGPSADADPDATRDGALALQDWQPLLSVGPFGRREGEVIASDPTAPGILTFGPYWSLPAGRYVVAVTAAVPASPTPDGVALASLKVVSGEIVLGGGVLHPSGLRDGEYILPFTVLPEDVGAEGVEVEIVLLSWLSARVDISGVRVSRIGEAGERDVEALRRNIALWAGMRIGPAGILTDEGVEAAGHGPGLLLSKTVALPSRDGRFEVFLDAVGTPAFSRAEPAPGMLVEVVAEGHLLARRWLADEDLAAASRCAVSFDLPPAGDDERPPVVEVRLIDLGTTARTVRSLSVEAARASGVPASAGASLAESGNLLPSLSMGIAHLEPGGKAVVRDGDGGGMLVSGPSWSVPEGLYQVGLCGALEEGTRHPGVTLDMVVDDVVVSRMTAWPSPGRFAFDLRAMVPSPRRGRRNLVQFRVFADQARGIALDALAVEGGVASSLAPTGFLTPPPGVGPGDGLVLAAGERSFHPLGAGWDPAPGAYRAMIHLLAEEVPPALAADVVLFQVEIAAGPLLLAVRRVTADDLRSRILTVSCRFAVGENAAAGVELRIWNTGLVTARVESVTVERSADGVAVEDAAPTIEDDWLPYLNVGPAGILSGGASPDKPHGVSGRHEGGGYLVYGPYRPASAGPCRAILEGETDDPVEAGLMFDMVVDDEVVSSVMAWPRVGRFTLALDAEISPARPDRHNIMQVRVWAAKARGLRLASLRVEPEVDSRRAAPVRPAASLPKDRRQESDEGGVLRLPAGTRGYHGLGDSLALQPGFYIATVALAARNFLEGWADATVLHRIEAVAGSTVLAAAAVTVRDLRRPGFLAELVFGVEVASDIVLKIWNTGLVPASVSWAGVRATTRALPTGGDRRDGDWLPYLALGGAGSLSNGDLRAIAGRDGIVAEGPGRGLPDGRYRVSVGTDLYRGNRPATVEAGTLEVLAGGDVLAIVPLSGSSSKSGSPVLEIRLEPERAGQPIALRLRSTGTVDFAILSADVQGIDDAEPPR